MQQQNPSKTLNAWKTAIRVRTLPIPTIQVVTASALAYETTGYIDPLMFVYTLLVAVLITIGTNLINDVYDFDRGGDEITHTGHMKVLRAGLLKRNELFAGGIATLIGAVILSVPLSLHASPWIIFVVSLSALCGFAYTGGRYPIAYLGLSEIFVFVFYGGVCILSAFYIQTGHLSAESWLLAAQMGLLAILPNAINNFRDMIEDATVNKKTLAVRFGKIFARWEIAICSFFPFLLNFYWIAFGQIGAVLFPLILLPLAFLFVKTLWVTEPGAVFNRFFALGVLIHFLFGFLLFIGWALQ